MSIKHFAFGFLCLFQFYLKYFLYEVIRLSRKNYNLNISLRKTEEYIQDSNEKIAKLEGLSNFLKEECRTLDKSQQSLSFENGKQAGYIYVLEQTIKQLKESTIKSL